MQCIKQQCPTCGDSLAQKLAPENSLVKWSVRMTEKFDKKSVKGQQEIANTTVTKRSSIYSYMGVSLEVGHFFPWYTPNLESIAQIFNNAMSIVYYVC
jgi:hypothetical protein